MNTPLTIVGPETLPASKLINVLHDQECVDNVVRLAGKYRRVSRSGKGDRYRPHDHISAEEMYDSCNEHIDQLLEIDERLVTTLVRGDYSIQNIGIVKSSTAVREKLDLPDAMKDDLFVACLDRITKELCDGVRDNIPDGIDPKEFAVYLTWRKNANRGPGMKCAAQEDANKAARAFLKEAAASPEGLFFRAFEINPIVMAVRRQFAGGALNSHGVFVSKCRPSVYHPDPMVNSVILGMENEPDDGCYGLRIRLINNVPMVSNAAMMIPNAIFMETLSKQLKQVWKTTPHELIDWGLGGIVHCTDFSGFENTITPEMREYIWSRIYAPQMIKVAKHIDRLPMVGAYTQTTLKEGNSDVDPSDEMKSLTMYDEKTIYWHIPRDKNEDMAKKFSPLLSGTGDTALLGKIVGLASQLRHFLLACGKSIEEVFELRDDGGSILSDCLRNTGDDAVINFSALSKVGFNEAAIVKCARDHAKSLDSDRLFDITLEDPKKYIGMVFWYDTLEDPIVAKTYAVSNDPLTLFTGRVAPEHPAGSPLRGDMYIGLAGTYHAYKDTMIKGKRMSEAEFDDMFDLLLSVIKAPFTKDELLKEALIREAKLQEEGNEQDFTVLAAKMLGIKPSELAWNVDRGQLEGLPDWLVDELWITVPSELTKDVTKYVQVSPGDSRTQREAQTQTTIH